MVQTCLSLEIVTKYLNVTIFDFYLLLKLCPLSLKSEIFHFLLRVYSDGRI